jgi:cytosine/adenosine deaminase-related metal-dependent hydrolase
MSKKKSDQSGSNGKSGSKGKGSGKPSVFNISRRGFLGSAAVGGISAAGLGFNLTGGPAQAHGGSPPKKGHGPRDRILLKGGIVLSLDPAVGDFEKADVLVEGKKIVAVRPNISANARVVDCSGLIVMPGFVSTHHHQYQTAMRSIIADGYIVFGDTPPQPEQQSSAWNYEAYTTVVQAVWTAGRIGPASAPLWDLGAPPIQPDDCYIAELVCSLAQITQGITCSTDTSQCSHTPQHTDAMIKGLMDSGARALYDYSGGVNRGTTTGFEFPGKIGNTSVGIGRIKKKYFSSDDQLVTLGLGANQNPVTNPDGTTESYSGWELARSFGAWINNHAVSPAAMTGAAGKALVTDPTKDIGEHLTLVHAVRWQDQPVVQVGANGPGGEKTGYPNPSTSEAWQIAADNGVHISIACPLELQMRHGMPPIQMSLNYGIMPSLSPDVSTNQSPDPFTMMRGAFNLQRGLGSEQAFNLSDPSGLTAPQSLTCRQVIEMMTIAGAAGSGLLGKVGTLTPGKEADIVFLETKSIDIAPMNNAPGAVVTMMDTSHVKHVMIAGDFKYWNYELVGWNVDKLIRDIERSRDRMLQRIRAVPLPDPGFLNSQNNPYRPNFLDSCCYIGQNTVAPHYSLRP